MTEIIEMGKMSSRGQICIPNDIREEMGLTEGTKLLFLLQDGSLFMKKITKETFAQITQPLKEEMKKSSLKESDVESIIHHFRKTKK